MSAELAPGKDLDQFFQCADATGKGDESVRTLEHLVLALVHVLGDDQFVQTGEFPLGGLHIDEKAGNDAGDLAAGGYDTVRHGAHDAASPAAVDEAQARFADGYGQGRCRRSCMLDRGRLRSRNRRRWIES